MPKDNKLKKEKKHFFRDFKAELKKVIWPTPKQLINNTIAVITIVLITAAIVFALDFVFENMNKYGINKIKEVVESHKQEETEEEEANDSAEDTETNNTTENNTTQAENNEVE
ncbi:MAG: preprotein translocase subunit SecE [Clostridia bacterium]